MGSPGEGAARDRLGNKKARHPGRSRAYTVFRRSFIARAACRPGTALASWSTGRAEAHSSRSHRRCTLALMDMIQQRLDDKHRRPAQRAARRRSEHHPPGRPGGCSTPCSAGCIPERPAARRRPAAAPQRPGAPRRRRPRQPREGSAASSAASAAAAPRTAAASSATSSAAPISRRWRPSGQRTGLNAGQAARLLVPRLFVLGDPTGLGNSPDSSSSPRKPRRRPRDHRRRHGKLRRERPCSEGSPTSSTASGARSSRPTPRTAVSRATARSDHDGSIMDDIAGMAGGLLGGRRQAFQRRVPGAWLRVRLG